MTEQEKQEIEALKTDHLIMKSDVHKIAESVVDIAESVKKIVEVKHHMEMMEQRQEDRHIQLKEADKLNREEIKEIRRELDAGIRPKTLKGILIWAGLSIISFGIWITLYTFAIDKYLDASIATQKEKNKNFDKYREEIEYNRNQITYLKGRIK